MDFKYETTFKDFFKNKFKAECPDNPNPKYTNLYPSGKGKFISHASSAGML
ncbi:hypothetical protein [Campylobacter jejuni]|uniref:hypothetical protein n=1 Tax=Campylobacter jejuni TaxID=197 RepID=UPI001374F7A8|nr:hypothetical protein [Campylobacter jejuni]